MSNHDPESFAEHLPLNGITVNANSAAEAHLMQEADGSVSTDVIPELHMGKSQAAVSEEGRNARQATDKGHCQDPVTGITGDVSKEITVGAAPATAESTNAEKYNESLSFNSPLKQEADHVDQDKDVLYTSNAVQNDDGPIEVSPEAMGNYITQATSDSKNTSAEEKGDNQIATVARPDTDSAISATGVPSLARKTRPDDSSSKTDSVKHTPLPSQASIEPDTGSSEAATADLPAQLPDVWDSEGSRNLDDLNNRVRLESTSDDVDQSANDEINTGAEAKDASESTVTVQDTLQDKAEAQGVPATDITAADVQAEAAAVNRDSGSDAKPESVHMAPEHGTADKSTASYQEAPVEDPFTDAAAVEPTSPSKLDQDEDLYHTGQPSVEEMSITDAPPNEADSPEDRRLSIVHEATTAHVAPPSKSDDGPSSDQDPVHTTPILSVSSSIVHGTSDTSDTSSKEHTAGEDADSIPMDGTKGQLEHVSDAVPAIPTPGVSSADPAATFPVLTGHNENEKAEAIPKADSQWTGMPDLVVTPSEDAKDPFPSSSNVISQGDANQDTHIFNEGAASPEEPLTVDIPSTDANANTNAIERPKSPYTPSYSVTSQGPGISSNTHPKDDQDSDAEEAYPEEQSFNNNSTAVVTNINESDPPPAYEEPTGADEIATGLGDTKHITRDGSLVTSTDTIEGDGVNATQSLSVDVTPQEGLERPKSPWTPSYSVTNQGAVSFEDEEELESLEKLPEPASQLASAEGDLPSKTTPAEPEHADISDEVAVQPSAITEDAEQPKASEDQVVDEVQNAPVITTDEEEHEPWPEVRDTEVTLINGSGQPDQTSAQSLFVGVGKSDHIDRPKSPWTPSYSVTTQGPIDAESEKELDNLEQLPEPVTQLNRLAEDPSLQAGDPALDQAGDSEEPVVQQFATSEGKEITQVLERHELKSQIDPADVAASMALRAETAEIQRPKSPYSPSYSVTHQGRGTPKEKDAPVAVDYEDTNTFADLLAEKTMQLNEVEIDQEVNTTDSISEYGGRSDIPEAPASPRSDLGIFTPSFDSRSEVSVASREPIAPGSPRLDPDAPIVPEPSSLSSRPHLVIQEPQVKVPGAALEDIDSTPLLTPLVHTELQDMSKKSVGTDTYTSESEVSEAATPHGTSGYTAGDEMSSGIATPQETTSESSAYAESLSRQTTTSIASASKSDDAASLDVSAIVDASTPEGEPEGVQSDAGGDNTIVLDEETLVLNNDISNSLAGKSESTGHEDASVPTAQNMCQEAPSVIQADEMEQSVIEKASGLTDGHSEPTDVTLQTRGHPGEPIAPVAQSGSEAVIEDTQLEMDAARSAEIKDKHDVETDTPTSSASVSLQESKDEGAEAPPIQKAMETLPKTSSPQEEVHPTPVVLQEVDEAEVSVSALLAAGALAVAGAVAGGIAAASGSEHHEDTEQDECRNTVVPRESNADVVDSSVIGSKPVEFPVEVPLDSAASPNEVTQALTTGEKSPTEPVLAATTAPEDAREDSTMANDNIPSTNSQPTPEHPSQLPVVKDETQHAVIPSHGSNVYASPSNANGESVTEDEEDAPTTPTGTSQSAPLSSQASLKGTEENLTDTQVSKMEVNEPFIPQEQILEHRAEVDGEALVDSAAEHGPDIEPVNRSSPPTAPKIDAVSIAAESEPEPLSSDFGLSETQDFSEGMSELSTIEDDSSTQGGMTGDIPEISSSMSLAMPKFDEAEEGTRTPVDTQRKDDALPTRHPNERPVESAAIPQEALVKPEAPVLSAIIASTGEPDPKGDPILQPFPSAESNADKEVSDHGSKPTLSHLSTVSEDHDRSAVDDTSSSQLDVASSPAASRKRLESTTSSRFFPGSWFSSSPKLPERTSLDNAEGIFVLNTSQGEEISATDPASSDASPTEEEKKGWNCIIM